MKTRGMNGRRDRAFALVAAIGVLAVLMIFAIAAAGTAQFTVTFSAARAADRRLGSALEEGIALLAAGGAEELKGGGTAGAGATTSTVLLIAARPGAADDVVVSATRGLTPEPGLLPPSLASREGDTFVLLEAGRADGRGSRRTALVLLNAAGYRRAPILLRETRP